MYNAEHYADPTARAAVGNVNKQDKLRAYLDKQIKLRRLNCIRTIQRPRFRDKEHVDSWLECMMKFVEED